MAPTAVPDNGKPELPEGVPAFFIGFDREGDGVSEKQLMLGNGAIARGLVENGCRVATAYPGTPSSEILAEVAALKTAEDLPMHVQWAVNEKVAFEIAYAGAMSGLRAAVSMKQVGLNVAADPLMSAAYMGTRGGFIVVSADDPGPHSSQTEQDSRLMAMTAKIPVLDPSSPAEAREMIALAYEISEAYAVPVMLRPTTRICHARQDISLKEIDRRPPAPDFRKDPTRWAATPKFRLGLHGELEAKLARIASHPASAPVLVNAEALEGDNAVRAVIASGVAAANTAEALRELGLWETVPLYAVRQPYPLHTAFIDRVLSAHNALLIIEETVGIIEIQLADRYRVRGKADGSVPGVGELTPERIDAVLRSFCGLPPAEEAAPAAGGRRPTLCAGCPHRATFFAIRKAAKKAIYTSDIGCYTLGLNLGAVDTVLCMGAAISQAAGFYHAFKGTEKPPPVVATIGDSTFFHAGVPALIDAVTQGVRIVLVILDNRTTAMTGNQPTPASGVGADGSPTRVVDIEALVRGCGVDFCRTADPYDLPEFIELLKTAMAEARERGPAVVIARHPCLLDRRQARSGDARPPVTVSVDPETCDFCQFCITRFECPALVPDAAAEVVRVDPALCSGCGVCVHVCPRGSILARSKGDLK